MKRNNNKGFTLAELLIVVAVIAVLVAVAIPTFTGQLEKSRQSVDASNLRGAYAAARLAEIDQAVDSETFKDVVKNGTVAALIYWYNPDTGALTRAMENEDAASVDGISAQLGKATKATVSTDMSQFSMTQIRSDYGTSLRTADSGTRDKAILVQFGTTSQADVYGIAKISFVKQAKGDSGAVAVINAGGLVAKPITLVECATTTPAEKEIPADPAVTNSFSSYEGQAKKVKLSDLFTFIAPVDDEGKAVTVNEDETKIYETATITKNGVANTTDFAADANGTDITVKSSATEGSYKIVFTVVTKEKVTSGTPKTYVTKVAVDVDVKKDTSVIPDFVTLASGESVNATLKTSTATYKPGDSISLGDVTVGVAAKSGDPAAWSYVEGKTYTKGYKLAYGAKNGSEGNVPSGIGDIVNGVMLIEDGVIPAGTKDMYLYVVYAEDADTVKIVNVTTGLADSPTKVQIG